MDMRLRGTNNSFIEFTKTHDFLIRGLGTSPLGRRASIDMYFRGTGGGGKLTTEKIAAEVEDALGKICFDRDVDVGIIPSLQNLRGKHTLLGDTGNFGSEEGITVARGESGVLSLELYERDVIDEDSRRDISFEIQPEQGKSDGPLGAMMIVSTQRQFAQLVNLALAIQEYALKCGK